MIKNLYSRDNVKMLSHSLRIDMLICVVLIIVAITVGVITCFFVTDENASLFKVIDIIVSSLCICVAVYFILNRIRPKRARKQYIERMLNSTSKSIRCKVIEIGKKITIEKYINLLELLVVNADGKELILYWDLENAMQNFVGHIVRFCIVNNKIIGYGDADETTI